MSEFAEFAERAARIIQVTLEHLNKKSHRLALLREGILINVDQAEVAARLFVLPTLYRQAPPREWDWRVNGLVERKFGSFTEQTNTITTIRYSPEQLLQVNNGVMTQSIVRQLHFETDINTVPENVNPRFRSMHLPDFYRQAPSWHEDLSEQVLTAISQAAK